MYDKYGNIIGEHSVKKKQIIQKEKNYIVYDKNGDIVLEDDLDENGNIQYEYDTRFLDENANILSGEEEYLPKLNNGENVYIACFVGCTPTMMIMAAYGNLKNKGDDSSNPSLRLAYLMLSSGSYGTPGANFHVVMDYSVYTDNNATVYWIKKKLLLKVTN